MAKLRDEITSLQDDVSKSTDQVLHENRRFICRVYYCKMTYPSQPNRYYTKIGGLFVVFMCYLIK